MKSLARLFTALLLFQTLLATPAQAGVLLFPASNQPQVQVERSQAAINVIAAGNWESGNAPTDAQSSTNVATLTARDPKAALANTLTLQQSADLERKQKEASQNAQAAQLVGGVLDGVIGDLSVKNDWKEGSPAKTILHGISGVVQAGLGGTSGLSGFAAGVVNEQIVGNVATYLEANGIPRYNKDGSANPVFGEFMVAAISLAGAGVGALTGGAKPANVAAAGSVAGTATVNNYLSHVRPSPLHLSEKEQYEAAVAGCANDIATACATRNELAQRSAKRDTELASACSGATPGYCNDKRTEAEAMGNNVTTTPSGFVYANSPESGSIRQLNVATMGPSTDPRTETFQDDVARSTAQGIVLESGNQVLGAVVGLVARGVSRLAGGVAENVGSGVGAKGGVGAGEAGVFDTGANITPMSTANAYRNIGANGTYVTPVSTIESITGPISPTATQITVTPSQASALEASLGLTPGSLGSTNMLSLVRDVATRAPRSPLRDSVITKIPF